MNLEQSRRRVLGIYHARQLYPSLPTNFTQRRATNVVEIVPSSLRRTDDGGTSNDDSAQVEACAASPEQSPPKPPDRCSARPEVVSSMPKTSIKPDESTVVSSHEVKKQVEVTATRKKVDAKALRLQCARHRNSEVKNSKSVGEAVVQPKQQQQQKQKQKHDKDSFKGNNIYLDTIRSSMGVDVCLDTIRVDDIFCERGGRSNAHEGNRRYRALIMKYRSVYQSIEKKKDKIRLSQSLVDVIHSRGGRFLKKVPSAAPGRARYQEISSIEARLKISQALRERKALKLTL